MAAQPSTTGLHVPTHPVRIVTASSLFDGHDASINIMRRIMQSQGAEVIHLGHNRSVQEVVDAAVEEDAQGVAVSSYQGGHVEYFEYLVQLLAQAGAGHVRVVGGGGGVIVPAEVARLREAGVTIFSPEDGQRLGLPGMVNEVVAACDTDLWASGPTTPEAVVSGDRAAVARAITGAEAGQLEDRFRDALRQAAATRQVPVLGITGTGGSGKSSLTDELVRRLRVDQQDKLRVACVAIDPTRRKGGGALLGDRIRMNSLDGDRVYYRSLATRGGHEVPEALPDVLTVLRAAGFDLVVVETPGIGQGDAAITSYADVNLYVMTPEFGAASQLEKIDMLDFADVVAINKFERRGAMDALRDVGRQLVRNRSAFGSRPEDMPVYGTSAATFNDDGVTALYQELRGLLAAQGLPVEEGALAPVDTRHSTAIRQVLPPERVRYLSEIAETVRGYHADTRRWAQVARRVQRLGSARAALAEAGKDTGDLDALLERARQDLPTALAEQLAGWPQVVQDYSGQEQVVTVRDREIHTSLVKESLSGSEIRRVSLPRYTDDGDLLSFLRREHLPGWFPFTAGVFRFKRDTEDPARMFAGEGDPFRTNRRFRLLSEGQPATRLSTAFDSVTLYGRDPDPRPDVYGKVGTSGVSVATLEDMKALYDGFDLTAPTTSVSMTINGPAPTILAFFLNTVTDRALERWAQEQGREPSDTEREQVQARALATVRGTVQADILKEDQGQNTCLFSTEFSLRMMADIQEWFIAHEVRNFYSVSISGYHIAEAGANPISQLAFTLANGFTYVEAYLARGMDIDDFAPNLSFFFSNGMDPEYTVIGRVARRIWAVAMREKYGAGERSQKLKYHVQTSGRSLHAQEMAFNDVRTTLQALCAVYDNANSLHTNAYDEAVTTPSEESVRRALAIQLVIGKEWGLATNENPLQGSFVVDELTDLVEEAVLAEFDRISERGGVLGAMETGYQRGRIQDESMLYEHRKHDGSLPIVGVNTFVRPDAEVSPAEVVLARATEEEKESQLRRVESFRATHREEAERALARLRAAATSGENVFAVLMDAARVCSLQQVTEAFFEVGGQYRRNV
ncbi:cobalamin B12-binding domain-containing protein [Phycicoccus endophyticus]|uniref:Fused isobutyryl-CoA mutase n=1 Tax=Phycicoccus endophyticus TaxID=1690220 RepID=A0A7G9QZ99_9MICO|nr:fused isobutyryl-CoA mutase/GTPase IcmF [Phycicoccus endophyticus]NHI19027.1 methylmalonyl-CoA mutase [Phycicoccus endophyticus]QNN48674.1 cobalamin B12-binding domain-containing protein [Phycicoccus endophyticus]GGL32254.1 Fused isobutyryl-CoA mutase [Phycicoccus endophyticus]